MCSSFEVEAAENLKKREMDLAKLAMTEASSNAADDKILKQAKAVKKRTDQDALVRRMNDLGRLRHVTNRKTCVVPETADRTLGGQSVS